MTIVRTTLDGATPPATEERLLIDIGTRWRVSTPDVNPGAITGPKIGAGAIDYSKFFTNLRPVEIVAVLPTLPNATYPNGSVVLLTTDTKLYRTDGATWTTSVTDADINSLTATKITAGTLSAAVILSGSIKTATTGARVEIDSAGIRLYDAGGVVTVNLASADGSASFKGTVTGSTVTGSTVYIPATTGDRMVMNNNVSGIGTGTLGVISFVKSADADSAPRGVIYLSSFDSTSTQLNMEARTSDGAKYARVRTTVDTVGGTYGIWFYINDGTNTPSGTVAKSSYDGTLLKFTSLSELPAHDAGFLPVAYPVGYGSVSTSSTLSLPANGGAIAIPVILTSPMKLQAAIVRNGDATLARSWEWRLYKDDNVNTPAEVVNANGTESFTATVASNRTANAQSPPVYLTPGVYWLVVRNTHATNAFTLVVGPGNVFGNAQDQTKTLGSALGSTLDLITGWTKQGYMPLTALQGRVFAQNSGY